MAHFIRVRTSGFWTTNSILLSSELEAFDAQLYKAVNGDDGGVWAPSAVIEIGGSGIKITGPALFTGTFTVTTEAQLESGAFITGGDLTVSQDIAVQGDVIADGDGAFGGTLTVAGASTLDDTTVQGTLNVSSNLDVQGTSHLTGNVTADGDIGCERLAIHGAHEGSNAFTLHGSGYIDGAFTIVGAAQVGGALTVVGAASLATLTTSGNSTLGGTTKAKGRFKRRVLTMTDANVSVSVSDYDMVFMPNGVMSADRTLNISTTGAEEGDVIRVLTQDSTYTLSVDWVDSNTALKVASDKQRWLELTFIGSVWTITAIGDRSA